MFEGITVGMDMGVKAARCMRKVERARVMTCNAARDCRGPIESANRGILFRLSTS